MRFGEGSISASATKKRRQCAVNRAFNGRVSESVDVQFVGKGGKRPTTHMGNTNSPEWLTFLAWVEQGVERGGRCSGPGCACEECCLRREPRAFHAPGAE